MPIHWTGREDQPGSSIWQGGLWACLDFTQGYSAASCETQQPQEAWSRWDSLRHS